MEKKYLKYKKKYLNLKNKIGGMNSTNNEEIPNLIEKIKENVLLVHAFDFKNLEHFIIERDYFLTGDNNYDFYSSVMKKRYARDTMIHCTWGDLVYPHFNGTWESRRCAIISPLKYQIGNVYKLFPNDTMLIGSMKLYKNDFVVILGIVQNDINVDIDEMFKNNKILMNSQETYQYIDKFKNTKSHKFLNEIKNAKGQLIFFKHGFSSNIIKYIKQLENKLGFNYTNSSDYRKNIRVNLTKELYGEDLSGLDIAEFLFIKLKQLMNSKLVTINEKNIEDSVFNEKNESHSNYLNLIDYVPFEYTLKSNFDENNIYNLKAYEIRNKEDELIKIPNFKTYNPLLTSLENIRKYYVNEIPKIYNMTLRNAIDISIKEIYKNNFYKNVECEKYSQPNPCYIDENNKIINILETNFAKENKTLFGERHFGMTINAIYPKMDLMNSLQLYFDVDDHNYKLFNNKFNDISSNSNYCQEIMNKFENLMKRDPSIFELKKEIKNKLTDYFSIMHRDLCIKKMP